MTILYTIGFTVIHYSILINYNFILSRELFVQWFLLYVILTGIIWYKNTEIELPATLINLCVILYGCFLVPLTESLTWIHQIGGYTVLCALVHTTLKIAKQNAKVSLTWDIYIEGNKEVEKQKLRKSEIWDNIIGR